jgi:uncharacterized MAPEG superfamily protein
MTIDLWMLVASAVLCVSIPFVPLAGLMQLPGGSAWGFGNRDLPFDVPPWVGRARRAHHNMVGNLAPFACLVLIAHVAGKANGTTALGAEIFFAARIAHALVYIIGIPVVRTLVFSVGSFGEVLILLQLLR